MPPRVLSFDVLGTLVDWDRGLADALRRHARIEHPGLIETLLEERLDAEWDLLEELEEFRPYREIVAESLLAAARASGTILGPAQAEAVAATVGDWPPFPDAGPALAQLAERFPLALVSNADRDDLERLAEGLGAPFRHLVAAGDVQAFKPEPDHLLALLHELELEEEELLHVSAWPEYDLGVAQDLLVPAAYVNRRGEPLPEEVEVAFEVASMEALARRLLRPRGGAKPRRRPARG